VLLLRVANSVLVCRNEFQSYVIVLNLLQVKVHSHVVPFTTLCFYLYIIQPDCNYIAFLCMRFPGCYVFTSFSFCCVHSNSSYIYAIVDYTLPIEWHILTVLYVFIRCAF